MPLNNGFYGVYKFATIRTLNAILGTQKHPYVIQSLTPTNSMKADPKFFMQGTPLTKVLDIGSTSESISVKAPILVPTAGNSIMDGLQLIYDITALQYTNSIPNNFLPLLESAKISIGVENSNVDLKLKSDGDPNNTVNVFEITYGTTAQNYITTTGLNNYGRVAKSYDFFVDFGGFKYFVEECEIDITIKNSEHNFLGVYPYPDNYVIPTDGKNNGVYQGDASYSGWQFPFIAVGGVSIVARGKAVISIDNVTGAITNYNYLSQIVQSDVNALIAAGNVTLQPSGVLRFTTSNFNIFYTGSTTLSGVLPPVFSFNKAVVTTKTSSFNEGVMTADFEVHAYVGATS